MRRDPGRMKQVGQTAWWKSECNDKITPRAIEEEGYNMTSRMRKQELRRNGKEI
jgi:hypothetical protein